MDSASSPRLRSRHTAFFAGLRPTLALCNRNRVSRAQLAMKALLQPWTDAWGGCRSERAVFKVLPYLKLFSFFSANFCHFLFRCVSGVFGIIIIRARAAPAPRHKPAGLVVIGNVQANLPSLRLPCRATRLCCSV